MSYLLPFEVNTDTGWKQASLIKEGDRVLCLDRRRGLEHKEVRQCIKYYSKFIFTDYSNGPFHIGVCEGTTLSPFFQQSMPCPDNSVLTLKCTEESSDSYEPEPDLIYASTDLTDLEGLQMEAIARGVHATVEHSFPEGKIRIREMPFVPAGIADSSSSMAISVSCDDNAETHLVIRLATLEECYKTFALIV